MGSNSTRISRWAPFVCAIAVILPAATQARAASITFLPAREAVLRHNGAAVRGGVKSITPEEVVVVLKTGVEKSYSMAAVTSVVASDNSFKYMPAQETFDEFLVKSASVRGVTIVRDDVPSAAAGSTGGGEPRAVGGVSSGYARSIGMQPPATPQIASSGGGFQQAGGFAGASQRPQSLARFEAPVIPEFDKSTIDAMEAERKAAALDAATPKFNLPGSTPKPTKPAGASSGAEEIFICSNPKCQKEVPGAKYGDRCPHCGIIWSAQSNAEALASSGGSSGPIADPRNPFAKGSPVPANNAAAAGGQAVPAPAPALPDAAAAPAEGFSLETIPWWGKLLGFGASIMVLMYIMGRR